MKDPTRRQFLASAAAACLTAGVGLLRLPHPSRAAAAPSPAGLTDAPDGTPEAVGGHALMTPAARQAVEGGLAYLARAQADDGSFGTGPVYRGNVGVTGLAGLAMLAGGHRPGAGPHGKVVERALEYVLKQEEPDPPGYFHSPRDRSHGPMYGHGFGTLFLGEALGVLYHKPLRDRVRETLGRAVLTILRGQNALGGWRYHPNSRDADISVTACQVMALRSARNAGVSVPREAIERCVRYVKACQDPSSGGFRYRETPTSPPGFARTAAGVSALYSAGVYRGPEVERGLGYLVRWLRAHQERPQFDTYYYYGHYYAAQALWTAGGSYWSEYYPTVREELLAPPRLRADGSWSDQICTHYASAMACIILQVPNNYLPILQK